MDSKKNRISNIMKRAPKPDSNCSAQTNKLLQVQSDQFTAVLNRGKRFIADEKNHIIDRIVMLLLLAYGLRISEVLNIRKGDINSTGTIIVRGKKGSDDRLISALQFSEWIYKNRLSFTSILEYRNRWYYYRLFKRLDIHKQMTGNKNTSVTHVFRYAFVADVKAMTGDTDKTAKIVGHKNRLNTKRYEEKT